MLDRTAKAIAMAAALLLHAPALHAQELHASAEARVPVDAGDFTLKVEPGLAFPLTSPQSDLFDVGGGETIKGLWALNPYLDIGPSATFIGLPADAADGQPGTAWAFGASARVKRPHHAAGSALAAISPWFDVDLFAYVNATAAVRGTPQAISGNLSGLTLYPGLYESGSSIERSPGGFLYLDAQGDSTAVLIIRSATTITTQDTSAVVLTKGAKANNVYWTAGTAITLGTRSIMKGTMIAGTALSLLTGANLEGRALNQGPAAAAVTLDKSTITLPAP